MQGSEGQATENCSPHQRAVGT